MKIRIFLLLAGLLFSGILKAQRSENSVWGALFHTQKFSPHWGASFDVQFRSADHADYLKNVLLRPSATYYFNKSFNTSLGYAYVATNTIADDIKIFRPEHRIFEQAIINQKVLHKVPLTHRFRLEQRFLGSSAIHKEVFAQRLRYFARGIVPFSSDSVFNKGAFLALQNEVFVNVQNKNKVNGHFFDQNRAYAALGYRISKMMDVEAGYMNQYTKQLETYTLNHIVQLAFYTRFGR